MEAFERTIRMIGEDAQSRLLRARVAVVGLGGVGGYVVEGLVRAGVGHLLLVDGDVVEESNLNRQILATRDTIGRPKSEVCRLRALSINENADIDARHVFYDETTCGQFDFSRYDFVVDAIDTLSSKLLLIRRARASGARVISCMGAGNKLDPSRFQIADIEKTSVCPLARRVRQALRKDGVEGVTCLFSTEPPVVPTGEGRAPGSISFVPSVAGLLIAGHVIRTLIGETV